MNFSQIKWNSLLIEPNITKKKPTQKLKIKAKQTTKPNRNINFQYESSTLRNEYTPLKNEITIFFFIMEWYDFERF